MKERPISGIPRFLSTSGRSATDWQAAPQWIITFGNFHFHLFFFSFWRNKNIRDTLVCSALRQNLPAPAGTFSCSRARCYTCSFLNSATSISGSKSNFVIRHNFTCTSSNIIYCISCIKCCKLYIGETGRRLSDRFRQTPSFRNEQWCWQACCATF